MTPTQARKLAREYAPIFAQKVSREWAVADQIAPIDLAGSIADVADNPNELHELDDAAIIPATVYYSVCETTTHFFLIYAVYHVLDWWKRYKPNDLYNLIRDSLDEHIHDMEGALLVVTKEPERLVDGLVTISHNNLYLYSEPRVPTAIGKSEPLSSRSLRVAKFNETVDGHIWVDPASHRVKLYIESRGHGMRGDHKSWGGGDEIWYYKPEQEREVVGAMNPGEAASTLEYQLEDIFERDGLWQHRFHDEVLRQHEDGRWGFVYRDPKVRKDALRGGAANPPWSWNDHNDNSPIGEIATDPARFIARYGQGWGPVSAHYLCNPYQAIGT